MTRYRWDRALHRTLSAILGPLDFRKAAPLCFVRKTPSCIQILNFGGRVQAGIFKFTCMVGIRFPEVESRLHPDNRDESCATVFNQFHFLCESRKYFEWEVSAPEDLEAVASSAVEEILTVATPYFERFSDLKSVEQALKSSDAFRTFGLSPHQRTGVLAAIALCTGRTDEAKAILSDAMSDPINSAPAKRGRIEEISRRLFPE